jgi:hypothetical protein
MLVFLILWVCMLEYGDGFRVLSSLCLNHGMFFLLCDTFHFFLFRLDVKFIRRVHTSFAKLPVYISEIIDLLICCI